MKKIISVLSMALERVKPSKEESKNIKKIVDGFLGKLNKKIKTLKLNAETFVGGSFAKRTAIKKEYYDVDIFIRFDKKYKDEEISKLTERLVRGLGSISIVHGSRIYFRIKIDPSIFLEIVPVMKIKKPKEAENITDLSYSHVKYINKKIKSQKLLDEILLAKAFCYANNCYGAESYINGFSGYGLELLVYHYGSFLKFIKAVVKMQNEKVVIDIEKHFKDKQMILRNLNSAKLHSPIILVDPTYKQRNVLAALSKETLDKFKKESKNFLKNPNISSFEVRKIEFDKIKKDAKKKKLEFILLEVRTSKQEGDIAGSKLLKFYKHVGHELERFFEIKKKGFDYEGKKSAKCFFVVKNRWEIVFKGPYVKDKIHAQRFKKEHKNTFTKNSRVYAKEKIKFGVKGFIENWKKKNQRRMKEMSVSGLRVCC